MARITRTPVDSVEDNDETETVSTVKDTEPDESYPVRSGWGAAVAKRTFVKRETAPKFEMDLKDLEEHIIKIHDDQPYVSYFQHVLNQGGWKYLTCSQQRDPITKRPVQPITCPMCIVGHNPSDKMMLNITDLNEREVTKAWTFGYEVQKQLQKFMKGPKDDEGKDTVIPIDRQDRYWMVQRSEEPRTNYSVLPLKERDLYEDHGVVPLSEEEIETLSATKYGKGVVWINSEQDLQRVADNYNP